MEIHRPDAAVWCPEDVPPARGFDARAVLGLKEASATRLADEAGCGMVVMKRDDERFATTADYDPRRLRVEVIDGTVVRIYGVD